MCIRDRDWFVDYKPLNQEILVRIGNGDFLKAYGKGNINVNTFDGEKWNKNHLADVLYVPDLSYNLFLSGVASVSYTHLDVYKRQHLSYSCVSSDCVLSHFTCEYRREGIITRL